jgi:hypothetical protein
VPALRTDAFSRSTKVNADIIPQCVRVWGKLSGEAVEVLLEGIEPVKLDKMNTAQLAVKRDRHNMLFFACGVKANDNLPTRSFKDLLHLTKDRYVKRGSLLSRC